MRPRLHFTRRFWASDYLDAAKCNYLAAQRLRQLARSEPNEWVADVLWTKAFHFMTATRNNLKNCKEAFRLGYYHGGPRNPYRRN